MTRTTDQITAELPQHVAQMVEIGIDSGEVSDRLLAVQSANSVDAEHGTNHGRQVLRAFMLNNGWEFKPNGQQDPDWSILPANGRTAELTKAITQSIGRAIGVKAAIFETVVPEGMAVLTNSLDAYQSLAAMHKPPKIIGFMGEPIPYDPARPYVIRMQYEHAQSKHNFAIAALSVTKPR